MCDERGCETVCDERVYVGECVKMGVEGRKEGALQGRFV